MRTLTPIGMLVNPVRVRATDTARFADKQNGFSIREYNI